MLETSTLIVLCGAASITFATFARDWRGMALLGIGFAAGVSSMLAGRVAEGGTVGIAAATCAGLLIARPHLSRFAAASGGLLAGFGCVAISADGLPPWAVIAAFPPLLAFAALLARSRTEFAPPTLREEALLAVLVLGLLTAVIPILGAGWRTATALQTGGSDSVAAASPSWALFLAAGALGSGMLVSLWRRR
jgi:hypothetical protein